MNRPFEYFDASATTDSTSTTQQDLQAMGAGGSEASLNRALDKINDLVAEMSAKDSEEGVPPEVVPILEALTGADDAPLAWASLHRRVQDGRTTWDSFWLDPSSEEDGMRLISAVMRTSLQRLQDGLAAARAEADDDADS